MLERESPSHRSSVGFSIVRTTFHSKVVDLASVSTHTAASHLLLTTAQSRVTR